LFDNTTSWTDGQKADAMEQAHRLTKHYIKIIREHSEMQAFIEELQTDNVNLENKLTKKQGAIEYLERHETTTSPAALIQTQAP